MNIGRTVLHQRKSLMVMMSEQQAHQQHTHGHRDTEMEQPVMDDDDDGDDGDHDLISRLTLRPPHLPFPSR